MGVGATAAAVAVALAGCSTGTDAASDATAQGGTFSVAIEKPSALTPTNCYDVYCAQVNSVLFQGLIEFQSAESGALEPQQTSLVDSIKTADNGKTWAITLNAGSTFTNGEKVTAQTFVDTWNYAANGDNGQQLGFVLGPDQLNVKGYEAVASGKAETLAGVTVDSDTVFTVVLEEPLGESLFLNFLGGPQLLPLPSVAMKESKAYEKQPIGNGPYQLDSPWKNQGGTVSRNPSFTGDAGNADSIEFKIYADNNALWADLQAGQVDVASTLPQNALASAEAVLGDRFINDAGAWQYGYYGYPTNDATFDSIDVRVGLAKAINWAEVSDKIYVGTRPPATSFAPATIPGGGEDVCGDRCVFDAEQAKKLIDGAGGVPGGEVRIPQLANESGDVQKAVCNQIQSNTGVVCKPEIFKNFGELLGAVSGDQPVKGLIWSLGWAADNPTIHNMITGNFSSSSPYNDIGYNNPEFDRLLQEGNAATDTAEQVSKWQQAEAVLYDDFRAYATLFINNVGGYSQRVSDVTLSPAGLVNLPQVVVVAG